MSRGSYQRRVYITVLQHNEGYTWHNKHMETFTGEPPGHWMNKMIAVKSKALERTRAAQRRPNFTRRSKSKHLEIEKDYGEAAVVAFEEANDDASNVNEIKQTYEVPVECCCVSIYIYNLILNVLTRYPDNQQIF